MGFGKRPNGLGGGRKPPPFLRPEQLSGDFDPWQKVFIIAGRPDVTNKDKPESEQHDMYFVEFRDCRHRFVHRQAYFSDRQFYPLLELFGIEDGLEGDDDSPIRGKELFVRFGTRQQASTGRTFVEIKEYSLADKRQRPDNNGGQAPESEAVVPFN